MSVHSSDESDNEYDEPIVKLVDGLNVKELIDTSVATFEVKSNMDAALMEQNTYFDSEDLLKHMNLDCIDPGSDDEDGQRSAPGDTPFETLALRMADMTTSGKVRKKIVREGTGDVVPSNALVWIHYNSWLEFGDEPYDSSYLRGRPHKARLNKGQFIPGLELGIASMKLQEIARFLIHSDFGYGRLGCPPRIPGGAELLVQVELLKYIDNAGAEEIGSLTEEERGKLGFPEIFKAAKGFHGAANDLFKKNIIPVAIKKYRKAVDLLESSRLKNEEEQEQHQKLLLKLYVNLAICYNQQKSARQACIMCKNALDIKSNCVKALFQYGKAQCLLGGFDLAEHFLKRAQKLEPRNTDVNDELMKLDLKKKTYKNDLLDFSKNAFKGLASASTKKEIAEDTQKFSEEAIRYLKEFYQDPSQNCLVLPSGLTLDEEAFFQKEATKMGLCWRSVVKNGKEHVYIKKDSGTAHHN